jgi:NCS1 family nucleobase:cation symporter-1
MKTLMLGSADTVGAASSMIAVGLSWKMAIGACVLGNTVMGLVITVNGRMGATVRIVHVLVRNPEQS